MNKQLLAELVNNFHLAKVAGHDTFRTQLKWATEGFNREHPEISTIVAYKELTGYFAEGSRIVKPEARYENGRLVID